MTDRELATLRGHAERVTCIAFSPDGGRLATGSGDSTIRVWVAATGREICAIRGHAGYVFGTAFSPDGRHLASAGGSRGRGEVKIWETSPLDDPTSRPPAEPGP